MPRRKLKISHHFPYHIVARSNNKERFDLPSEVLWGIFCELLTQINLKYSFQIHAFVLMSNHYHLLGTASETFPLPKVMEWFQRSANRMINGYSGRINHLFGGPYKATLITDEQYYFYAFKYVLRNPVEAKIVDFVQDYPFSSLLGDKYLPVSCPINGINSFVVQAEKGSADYLNEDFDIGLKSKIMKAISKAEFKISARDY